MVKADAVVLGATKGISTEEADKAEIQAAELVRQIEEAGGSLELDLLDGITSVGGH